LEQLKSRYDSEIRTIELEARRYKEENFSMRGRIEQLDKMVFELRAKDSGRDVSGLNEKVYRLEG
jgi:hypothetical protein